MKKTQQFIKRVSNLRKQMLSIDFTRSAFSDYLDPDYEDPTEVSDTGVIVRMLASPIHPGKHLT